MSMSYLGQIKIFAFNYAPQNWALCQGQLMPISRYTSLFSILGNAYGGDGTTNFALPNLQGIPVGAGQAPGASNAIEVSQNKVEDDILHLVEVVGDNERETGLWKSAESPALLVQVAQRVTDPEVQRSSLRIYTSLDPELQRAASEAVAPQAHASESESDRRANACRAR